MKKLLNNSIQSTNPNYIALVESPRNAQLRQIAEELWVEFHLYADPHFPQKFADHLHQRFWEMYLAIQLLHKNIQLIPRISSMGPDIHAQNGDQDIWIEAVAPTEGVGLDAVPKIMDSPKFEPLPEDKIILRFTNALLEKHSKHSRYLESGLFSDKDPYVIAINGRSIQMIIFDGPLPAIVKAVYPVGDLVVAIDPENHAVVSEGYQVRQEISKESGSPVSTNAFLDPTFSGISGLLYSDAALWDMPSYPGSEFLYIHNSVADNPLPSEWLCQIREVAKDGNHLVLSTTTDCA